MIWIGNQTSCWAAALMEPFDYALANGFDAFEWFPDKKSEMGWDETDLDDSQRERIRDIARGRGVRLSVHARWQANPLQLDSYPLLWTDLELAQELGAALLNIHLYHEAGLAAFVSAVTPLIQRAAETGLQLAIENTPLHAPELLNELFARLNDLPSALVDHVGLCLDIGHANLCSATLNNYLAFLDRLESAVPIKHLHLHENWGDADTHLPLFTGPAALDSSGIRDFIQRIRRRQFSGSMILEQWPNPPALLNHARTQLLALLDGAGFPRRTPHIANAKSAQPPPKAPAPTPSPFETDDSQPRWQQGQA